LAIASRESAILFVAAGPNIHSLVSREKLAQVHPVAVWRLFTFNCRVRGLLLSRGSLTSALGATARFNAVDLSSVFLPPLTKSMSSLSPLDTLTCPMPNKAWAIQSCGLQFLMLTGSAGATFAAFISTTSSEGAE